MILYTYLFLNILFDCCNLTLTISAIDQLPLVSLFKLSLWKTRWLQSLLPQPLHGIIGIGENGCGLKVDSRIRAKTGCQLTRVYTAMVVKLIPSFADFSNSSHSHLGLRSFICFNINTMANNMSQWKKHSAIVALIVENAHSGHPSSAPAPPRQPGVG